MQDIEKIRSALAYVPRFLEFQHQYHPLVGTQVAVRVDGELELNQAFGIADVETGSAMTVDHLFRIASHSKTFAAVACMQLVEAGKLRLDDTVGTHVPELSDAEMAGATVREILGHGSGMIRDGDDSTWWQLAKPFPDRAELIDVVRRVGKLRDRNKGFKYSNISYSVIGLIIEAVSGQDFREYCRKHIIDPLGLVNTGPDWEEARVADFASGHSSRAYDAKRRVIEHIDTFAESSATGFYSTAAELTGYFQAHLDEDDRLLSDDSKRQMRQVQWQMDEKWGYGLGLSINKVGKQTYYGHGGGYPGHITMSRFDPERKLSISVFTNSIDGPAAVLCDAILGLIDLALKTDATTDPREAGELAGFEGRYAGLWGVFDVVNLGGRLYMLDPIVGPPAGEPAELEVVSDTELRLVAGAGTIAIDESAVFTFDDDGSVIEVRGPGGMRSVPIDDFELPERVRRPQ